MAKEHILCCFVKDKNLWRSEASFLPVWAKEKTLARTKEALREKLAAYLKTSRNLRNIREATCKVTPVRLAYVPSGMIENEGQTRIVFERIEVQLK